MPKIFSSTNHVSYRSMEKQGFITSKDALNWKTGTILKSILKVYEIYQNKTKDLNAFDF